MAATGFDGAVLACKAGGPAGTYSFHVEKAGGGSSWYPYGQDATVTFDGTNMVCAHMWSPLDVTTWGPGVTGTVTVTETALPAGVVVDYIQVWDSRNQVFLTPNVTGSNSVTIAVDGTNNLFYAKFYNKTTPPPPPPVSANCVSITAVQGLAITPVTLTGSGGTGGPYTFSATGLPAGVTMSSSGTISGTPTVSGTFNYTVTVTDKDGNSGTVHCTVTVQPPPPPTGGEGCTPGYWKQSQHIDSWAAGIFTTQNIAIYFPSASLYSLNGKTLDQYSMLAGLSFQGGSTASGKAETLLRAAIAGLLNAAGGTYAYTTAEVISMVNAALASGNLTAMNTLAGKLDEANNAGCTLN